MNIKEAIDACKAKPGVRATREAWREPAEPDDTKTVLKWICSPDWLGTLSVRDDREAPVSNIWMDNQFVSSCMQVKHERRHDDSYVVFGSFVPTFSDAEADDWLLLDPEACPERPPTLQRLRLRPATVD